MGTYSGNFIRTYATAQESAGSFHPDPRHAVTQTPDPYGAVHQVPADTGAEYAGTQMPVDMAVGGGSMLATPSRSHQGLGGRRHVYSDDQYRETLPVRHAPDGQRRLEAHDYQPPLLQDSRSVWSDTWTEDNTWPSHPNNTGAPAILRSRWSAIPQNNPEGVRAGMDRQNLFRAERRLGRRKYRYNIQPLIDRFTYQDANVPAPRGANPTAAGSVLDSWTPARMYADVKIPGLFRQPPSVDETALAAEPTAGYDTVIGGGL